MSCGKQEGESLRVPLLWRHSWDEQDFLRTTRRVGEKCLVQELPKQAVTRRASSQSGHAALFETSSTSQPISDIIDIKPLRLASVNCIHWMSFCLLKRQGFSIFFPKKISSLDLSYFRKQTSG
ncbi:uncharacterized protein LOC132710346 isoform X3 [Pantherophis guttatus]|uniref:Uncharacterized protein LOC132710346 isoform X3 n=1 Tax=Pantherophis guttatus TaxID=94885 RepID=A0ABM3Z1V2_PANGU|nr:uncharacterized protein LOC132710346 isoform X3 [Pantherophis guttatus]